MDKRSTAGYEAFMVNIFEYRHSFAADHNDFSMTNRCHLDHLTTLRSTKYVVVGEWFGDHHHSRV